MHLFPTACVDNRVNRRGTDRQADEQTAHKVKAIYPLPSTSFAGGGIMSNGYEYLTRSAQ